MMQGRVNQSCEAMLAIVAELDIPLSVECSKVKEELEKIREEGE